MANRMLVPLAGWTSPVVDALTVTSLIALAAGHAWCAVDFSVAPDEDAAILMRYAEHLAAGRGIVWNLDAQRRTALVALAVVASVGILAYGHSYSRHIRYWRDGRYDLARAQHPYRDRGYTLATTEAGGLRPLYSEWRAVDTAGLNDAWIAHHGGVTAEYLDRFRRELVRFHESFSPLTGVLPREDGRLRMTATLPDYVEQNGCVLATSYGDAPYDTQYDYVRPGFSDSAEVVRAIRDTDSIWHETDRRALDFTAPCRRGGG